MISREAPGFFPEDAPVPEEKRTPRLVLRPLRATDVELDYDAVMSSTEELRRWSGSEWPADGFTLAENLADLERHEREHNERKAFTFTILNAEGTRCLGCVYIVPIWPEAVQLCEGAAHAAAVGFWVRTSELAGDLDRHLIAILCDWFRNEWAFDTILFTSNPQETRQAALLAEPGLVRSALTWPDGRPGWAFRQARYA
jgi:RimJ/RimL family protein N-acetyltransferase